MFGKKVFFVYVKMFFCYFVVWVLLIGFGMMFLFVLVLLVLSECIGCWVVVFVGGLLGVLGFVLLLFVINVYFFYVMFGIFWGIGVSMSYLLIF